MTDEAAKCLRSAEIELQDLQRYWSGLCWWEREAALHNVSEQLEKIKDSDYAFRCGLARDIAKELSVENEKEYPTSEELATDKNSVLLYAGQPPLNMVQAMELLKHLSKEDISALAAHIGTETNIKSLINVMDRSMSAFYAVRNRVGDIIRNAEDKVVF